MIGETIVFGFGLVLGLADASSSFEIVSQVDSAVATTNVAEYTCIMRNRWTRDRHPEGYPSDAGFSKPVLVSHSDAYLLFEEGSKASGGVQAVAETGDIGPLVLDIFGVNLDNVLDTDVGLDMTADPTMRQRQVIRGVKVGRDHAQLSAISKISPSPDWFTGFSQFTTFNTTSKTWWSEFVIYTFPFDAGTLAGDEYLAEATAETSPLPIMRFTEETVPSSTQVFLNPDKTQVLPVVEWNCELA